MTSRSPKQLPEFRMAEGGLVSSVRDQLRYAAFHLGASGEEPVGAATRELMQREHVPLGVPWTGIGLPWLLDEQAGVRLVTHGGNIGNLQLSSFVLVPERGFAVTTLTNSAPGKALGNLVIDWCLEHLLGATPQAVRLTLREPGPEYAGSYDAGQWTFEVDAQTMRRRARSPRRPRSHPHHQWSGHDQTRERCRHQWSRRQTRESGRRQADRSSHRQTDESRLLQVRRCSGPCRKAT
nr:serine hydrolase [Microtetraspora sp. NBRC 16547]